MLQPRSKYAPFGVFSSILALAAANLLVPVPGAASPLTSSPGNQAWLFQGGTPFFLCGPGDPEDFLYRGALNSDGTRSGDQDAIIAKLAGTGANSLWMAAVRSHGGDGGAAENPFVNHDPSQALNAAVLDQWDGWLEALDAAGIVTFFVFYDDGSSLWNTGSSVGASEESFFTQIVNRFEDYDSIIWCIAEEYSEALHPSRVSALAALIAQEDDFGHPITTHQTPGTEFHFGNDANQDSFAMQSAGNDTPQSLHDKVVDAWEYAGGRYNVIMAESVGHYTDRSQARKLSWAAAMGGGYVLVQAMDVASTPVEALEDCGRLASFFRSTEFHRMSPRDDLRRGQTQFVFGAPGVGYILYAASSPGNLAVELEGGVDAVDLTWVDCITGTQVTESGVAAAAGENSWRKPNGLGVEVALSVTPSAPAPVSGASWGGIKALYRDSSRD